MLKGYVSLDVWSVEHPREGVNQLSSRFVSVPSSDSLSMASEKSFTISEPFWNTCMEGKLEVIPTIKKMILSITMKWRQFLILKTLNDIALDTPLTL